MDPCQTRRVGKSEKQENGLRLMNYYSTTTKNTFFKKTLLTVLKTLCYLKKNDKNRLAALTTINF
jgi:hypothetical protein